MNEWLRFNWALLTFSFVVLNYLGVRSMRIADSEDGRLYL